MQKIVRRARSASSPAANHSVLGLDVSLNSTGYAYRKNGEVLVGTITNNSLLGPARLSHAAYRFEELLDESGCTHLLIEDYAFAGKGRIAHLGEMGGVLRLAAYRRGGMTIASLPNGTLKLVFTGKGRHAPGKDKKARGEMSKYILNHYGYDILQNDEADAFALLVVGEAFYNRAGPSELVSTVHTADNRRKFRMECGH